MNQNKSTNVRSFASRHADHFAANPVHRLLRRVAAWFPRLAAAVAWRVFFLRPPRRRDTAAERRVRRGARAGRVATRWGALAFVELGTTQTAAAKTAILVHGWAGSGAQLFEMGRQLARDGHRVIALDLPGHGRSPGWRSSLPRWAEALSDAVERLVPSGEVVLVAHSFGATATMLALARSLHAESVVLLAPAAEPGSYFRGWIEPIVGSRGLASTAARVERWLGISFADVRGAQLARGLTQRVLILHDRDDRETPLRGAEEIAAACSDAELVVTAGLGHARLLQDPGVILRVRELVGVEGGPRALCVHGQRLETCQVCALERDLVNPEGRRVRAVG